MKFWNEYPLYRILIPMILGISFGYKFPNLHFPIISVLIVFFAFFLWIFRSKKYRNYRTRYITGLLISVLFLLFGFQLTWLKKDEHKPFHYSNSDSISHILIQINEPLIEKAKSYKTIGLIKAIYKTNDSNAIASQGKILLYFSKNNTDEIAYGDQLLIKNRLQEIKGFGNPYEFDYAAYLSKQNIYEQAYLLQSDWVKTTISSPNYILKISLSIRKVLLQILQDFELNKEEFAVASAILLGYDEYLDQDLRQLYAGSGAMHILCVSGLHVGIIFLIFNTLLGFIKRWKYGLIVHSILLVAIIWMYALITGLSPSVSRAATMFSFISLGSIMQRKTSAYNSLAASAVVLLIINPFLLFHIGFQLSYLAVLSILFLQPHLSGLINTPYVFFQKIRDLLAVSVAAQLGTFPLAIYYFHQFPNYFFITNLIVIPLSFVILFAGFINIAIYLVGFGSNWVGEISTGILEGALIFLNASMAFINELPFAVSQHLYFTVWDTFAVYAFILFFSLSLIYRKYKFLMIAIIIMIVIFGGNTFLKYQAKTSSSISIYYIPKHSLIDLNSNGKSILLGDSALWADTNLMVSRFYEENHLHLRIKETTALLLNKDLSHKDETSYLSENYLYWSSKRILLIDKKIALPSKSKEEFFNYLIFRNNPKISLYQLDSLLVCDTIISDGSNSYWNNNKWKQEADSLGLFFWDTKEDGAFTRRVY